MLRRDFEYSRMSEGESLSTYLTKKFNIMNQMKTYETVKSEISAENPY